MILTFFRGGKNHGKNPEDILKGTKANNWESGKKTGKY